MQLSYIFYGHFTTSLIVNSLFIVLLLIALYKRAVIVAYLNLPVKLYSIILCGLMVACWFALYNFVSLRSNPLFVIDKKGLTYANTTIAWNEIKHVYCLSDYYNDSSWYSRWFAQRTMLKHKDYLIVVPHGDEKDLINRFPLNYRLGKVVEEIKGTIGLTVGFSIGIKYLETHQLKDLCSAIEETSGLKVNTFLH